MGTTTPTTLVYEICDTAGSPTGEFAVKELTPFQAEAVYGLSAVSWVTNQFTCELLRIQS